MGSRILFLIRSLYAGGSERQLVTLATGLHARGHHTAVATFYPGGDFEPELVDAGVPLLSLGKRGRWDLMAAGRRLIRLARAQKPAVLHSYLPDANILATMVKPFLPGVRLVWGVRAAFMDPTFYDRMSRASYRTAAALARRADLVIANSIAAAEHHRAQGYPTERLRVVHNGVDVTRFGHDEAGRARIRREWGSAPDTPLIGLVGRLDPMKDHSTFLRAAALFAARRPDARFVCVGTGPSTYLTALREEAAVPALERRVTWAGRRSDLAAVYSALDVATCTSIGESFPNVIAEAMACGTPCVATNVGDVALLVAGHGTVVRVRDPGAIVEGWERELGLRSAKGARERRDHIVEHFSQSRLISETESLLIGPSSGGGSS